MKSRLLVKLSSIFLILAMLLSISSPMFTASAQPPVPQKPTTHQDPVSLDEVQAIIDRGGPAQIMIELTDTPAALIYGELLDTKASTAVVNRATIDQTAKIQAAQAPLIATISSPAIGGKVIFQVGRAYNGIAMQVDASKLAEIAALPGVKAVHPLSIHTLDNAFSVPAIGAPFAWDYALGNRGAGMKIGIIDSGIDYLHTDFGGPGTPGAYAANNTTIVGDVPNFPGTKVAGGYDFAGDAYTGYNTPVPDGDPSDCLSDPTTVGHGTHVSGTAAGYGVNADGSTYLGSYGASTPFGNLLIGPGVAPEAKLYALRVFGCQGSTGVTTAAIDWAIDPNNDGIFEDHLDVINMSLGSSFGGIYDDSVAASDNAAKAGVIVVASSGNSGDVYYVTGSPSLSTRTISVANSVAGSPGLKTDFPAANTVYNATLASNGGSLTVPGVTAELKVAPNLGAADNEIGCGDPGVDYYAGKIALIKRGTCGFYVKAYNAQLRGALAVVLYNNAVGSINPTVQGIPPVTIPVLMLSLANGTTLRNAVFGGTVVTATVAADVRFNSLDTIDSSTSRGPRRYDSALKPDITAPGSGIISAANQSGTGPRSMSGTSMAAPHMTGVMALLKQLHPSWTVEELKALAMNTATHDLYTGAGQTGEKYSPSRIGAGRVDVAYAVQDGLLVYSTDDPGAVSVSFGSLEVQGVQQYVKHARIVNKNGKQSPAYTVTFDDRYNTPGVSFAITAGGVPLTTVQLPAFGTLDIVITMTADAALMKHTHDTATPEISPYARMWLTEAGGYLNLTQVNVPSVRLPVYAVPRPASSMEAADHGLIMAEAAGMTGIELEGTPVHTGTDFPYGIQSLVTAFELKEVSPAIPSLPVFSASGDLKYVGVMSDYQPAAPLSPSAATPLGATLYFAISTYGKWSTAQGSDTRFNVCIDLDKDGVPDKLLLNQNSGTSSAPSDVQWTVLFPSDANCNVPTGASGYAQYHVNYLEPKQNWTGTAYDTNTFNTDVIVFAVDAYYAAGATQYGLGMFEESPDFNFWVKSYPRDAEVWPVDTTAMLHYNAIAKPVDTTGGYYGLPFWYDEPGVNAVPAAYNKANFETDNFQGVLLLHHHNTDGTRAEVVWPAPDAAFALPSAKFFVTKPAEVEVSTQYYNVSQMPDDIKVDGKVTLTPTAGTNLGGLVVNGFAVIGGTEVPVGSITLASGQTSFWLSDFSGTPFRPAFNTQANQDVLYRFKFVPGTNLAHKTILVESVVVGAELTDFNTAANWYIHSNLASTLLSFEYEFTNFVPLAASNPPAETPNPPVR